MGLAPQPIPEEGATVAASPDARRRSDLHVDPLVSRVRSSQVALAASTARVIRADEAARALAFCRAIFFLAGIGICAAPFLYDPTRRLYWPMVGTLVAIFLVSSWMWWRAAGERGHSRRAFRIFLTTVLAAALFVDYDLGIFSPAPLFVTLGLTFVTQSHDRLFAIGATVLSAVAYVTLALLVVTRVVPDLGLFSSTTGPLAARLLFVVMVPVAYGVAGWQGRKSRRATLAAIDQSHEAIRLALTREAQLAEANQNLDVALRAGAGANGRYSGAQMGRYRLAEIIGRGAMGEIYAAADVASGQRAAVKVLRDGVCADPDLVERFFREGRIAASLAAPNVVTVYDVGGASDGGLGAELGAASSGAPIVDGVPFIAMELLAGEDLSAQLRRRERLDLPDVVELCAEVARGLAAAHAAGVVHRDLKPHNIFWAEQGGGRAPIWKILDFGISKLRDGSATLTHAAVIGTPGYMAPEQAEGRDVDHRTDLFALGAVAYRALTGRPPFSGDLPQVLFEIAYRSAICPSELCPELPADVDLVLALALAKRAEDRFDSAPEMAGALRDAARGALDPALRARAAALLEEAPWGSSLRLSG